MANVNQHLERGSQHALRTRRISGASLGSATSTRSTRVRRTSSGKKPVGGVTAGHAHPSVSGGLTIYGFQLDF